MLFCLYSVGHLKRVISVKGHADCNTVLSFKDSKRIWGKIIWKGSLTNENTDRPELKDLCDHFKAKSQTTHDSTVLCEVTVNSCDKVLNKPDDLDDTQKARGVFNTSHPTC